MNELSERLRKAADFLKRSGYAKNDSEMADKTGILKSTFSLCANGMRVPTLELLLDFCDAYPIDFQWMRTGKGRMVKVDREAALLKRIEELEAELARFKE